VLISETVSVKCQTCATCAKCVYVFVHMCMCVNFVQLSLTPAPNKSAVNREVEIRDRRCVLAALSQVALQAANLQNNMNYKIHTSPNLKV